MKVTIGLLPVLGQALLIALLGIISQAWLVVPSKTGEAKEATIIHAGKLLAVPGEAVVERMSITIVGNEITDISPGYVAAKNAKIIDLKNSTVIPGLIDSHVHLLSELSPNRRLDRVTKSDVDRAFDGAANARKTLLAGFTTVQDVGGGYEIFALRDAVRDGKVVGPRIRASGPSVSPTAGHGDIHGYNRKVLQALARTSLCDGPAACRKATRQAIKMGADIVKITATGGVLSNTAAGTEQQFFDDEMVAIVETAKKMGRKVTAHAHGKTGIEAALRAGVSSIEHGTYLDEKTAFLFKKNEATLVPTVLAGMTVVDMAKIEGALPPASRAKALRVGPQMIDMLHLAHSNGVNIAFGTDTGVSKHGDNAKEFVYMVEAGFSEMEALRSATVIAAEHVEMADKIGTVEVGKFADIIAVKDNPLDDISALANGEAVHFVMKDGVVYRSDF